MNCITIDKPAPTVVESSSDFITFLLGQIRCAELRARIAVNELRATAVALSGGLIGAEDALAMLGEAGLDFIIAGASSE
jgi:hypothetical protein